jgi:hypothetical protein
LGLAALVLAVRQRGLTVLIRYLALLLLRLEVVGLPKVGLQMPEALAVVRLGLVPLQVLVTLHQSLRARVITAEPTLPALVVVVVAVLVALAVIHHPITAEMVGLGLLHL